MGFSKVSINAENVLKVILSKYDGNGDNHIECDIDIFKNDINTKHIVNIKDVIKELCNAGLIERDGNDIYINILGGVDVILEPEAHTYFEDKEKYKEKEKQRERELKLSSGNSMSISNSSVSNVIVGDAINTTLNDNFNINNSIEKLKKEIDELKNEEDKKGLAASISELEGILSYIESADAHIEISKIKKFSNGLSKHMNSHKEYYICICKAIGVSLLRKFGINL